MSFTDVPVLPCQAGSGLLAVETPSTVWPLSHEMYSYPDPAHRFNHRVKLQKVLPGLVSALTNAVFLFCSVEFLG